MTVKELVANECANHSTVFNEIRDYCCLEATPGFRCIFMASENPHPRCRYFEESVLPLEPALEAIYRQERIENVTLSKAERAQVQNRFKTVCAECGKLFTPASNRQKYCLKCRTQATRERERLKKQRQRHSSVPI